jgi:predicted nucleic-acid-binding Zn-ribbon protein
VDPRIITEAYNGVKLKGNDIRKIFHTKLDKYIVITNELIKYVRITI